jgi:hypothetical protein
MVLERPEMPLTAKISSITFAVSSHAKVSAGTRRDAHETNFSVLPRRVTHYVRARLAAAPIVGGSSKVIADVGKNAASECPRLYASYPA